MRAIQRFNLETAPHTLTENKPPRGLTKNWQIVNGQLVCAWVKHPN